MKNIYEIFDEFESATNKKQRMEVIGKNLSKVFTDVLQMCFHPQAQWYFSEVPDSYVIKEVPAGMGYSQLSTELRKMYMFQKGNPTADKLTDKKREQLLVEFLQNLEPREAEVIIGIFNKDFGVRGLDYKFVKEAFPNLLP
jgi:hypothetical protein